MRLRITEREARIMYDDMLDEVIECSFGNITYTGSDVLKKVDPIAYRCGFNDYVDSISDEYIVEGYTDNEDSA